MNQAERLLPREASSKIEKYDYVSTWETSFKMVNILWSKVFHKFYCLTLSTCYHKIVNHILLMDECSRVTTGFFMKGTKQSYFNLIIL